MELEQRVKALEYEMKILKNEIQRTLLDIQEQILIHYYPSLRAGDDTEPSEGTWQSLESIRERKAALGGEASPDASPVLPVKKVSLEEIRPAQEGGSASSDGGNSSTPAGGAGQTSIVELSGWVSDTVKSVGGDRAVKLIKACAGKEWITPESEDVLLRLASLSSDDVVPETVAVNEVLTMLLKLNELLGRRSDVEQAITLIEEADLG